MTAFDRKKNETMEAVAQITNWCALVALHQTFGVGSVKAGDGRQHAVIEELGRLQNEYIRQVSRNPRNADKWLKAQLPKGCRAEFTVPITRRAKPGEEELLRQAANDGATLAWCMIAASAARVLGYGAKRLEALRRDTLANYRQFNQWSGEDGKEVAFERLRRCLEAALREDLVVVEKDEERQRRDRAADQAERQRMAAYAMMQQAGRKLRPDGWAVVAKQEIPPMEPKAVRDQMLLKGLRL